MIHKIIPARGFYVTGDNVMGDGGSGEEFRRIERLIENANQRISNQRETFQDFSQQGMRMFRLLLLVLAAPAAILGGFAPDTAAPVRQGLLSSECAIHLTTCAIPIDWLTLSTGFLFLVAAGLNIAATGFDARGTYDLVNPEDIVETMEVHKSQKEFQRWRLYQLCERIYHNDKIISVKESWLAYAKAVLFLAIFLTATLSYSLLSGDSINGIVWLMILGLYVFILLVFYKEVPDEFKKADNSFNPDPLYDEDRVSEFISDREKGENNSEEIGKEDE